MNETLQGWLVEQGMAEGIAGYAGWLGVALAIVFVAYLSNYIAKRFLVVGVRFFVKKSKATWDDSLTNRKVFARLSHLAPALVVYFSAFLFPQIQDIIQRLSMVYMILVGLYAFNSLLSAAVDIYHTFEISKHKPIKGYVQLAKIIISIFVSIIALATLMNRSPWLLLSGLGAMTAVMLLVFKDSILGLVASVQLSINDMVHIGDWIEMPKYGANGDVIDVSLHTVKVRNWDKTITTIPAYSLISDSFKNWRGMAESGGRRIKRAINIDMGSITFCTEEMLDRFEKFQLISEYIKTKRKEIAEYNEEQQVDISESINQRRLTNIGTFRAYIVAYLRNHARVKQDMTFLIRHLPPGDSGLPVQVYVFSNVQEWAEYEAIQADIFDHLLAVVPQFDLRVFQQPTGGDLRALTDLYQQVKKG